jgi:hypothetical protein
MLTKLWLVAMGISIRRRRKGNGDTVGYRRVHLPLGLLPFLVAVIGRSGK